MDMKVAWALIDSTGIVHCTTTHVVFVPTVQSPIRCGSGSFHVSCDFSEFGAPGAFENMYLKMYSVYNNYCPIKISI